jgi:hypothetical protein
MPCSIPGWPTGGLLPFYAGLAHTCPDHTPLVEVGCWLGASVIPLAKALKKLGRRGVLVYAVDTFDGGPSATPEMRQLVADRGGSLFEDFRANLVIHGVEDFVVPMQLSSLEAAQRFRPESVHCVTIDADHTEASVAADITAWLPRVRVGGVLAGHDYADYVGVAAAVKRLLPKHNHWENMWSYEKQ